MARRKFRNNQRREPTTERSLHEYLISAPVPQTSRSELMRLVRGGEDTFLELKVKLSNPEKVAQEIVALANAGGGTIVFGISDQMRIEGVDDAEEVQRELVHICREQIIPPLFPYIDCISFDSGRRIVALEVRGKRRPYRTRDGRFFVRFGAEKREASPEDITALLDEGRPFSYETMPVIGARIEDIDEAHLWSFMREFAEDASNGAHFGDYPTAEVLEHDLLLATDSEGALAPTVAGMLLFGKSERVAELLPRACVVAVRFAGDTAQSPIVERAQLVGNLYTLYESALRFVRRYCDLLDERPRDLVSSESPVIGRAAYHRGAVSEAIANALVHRDLSVRDAATRIHIFDRSIEVSNPRRTAGFVPFAQRAIRYGVPQRLNPQIAAIFSNPAYGLDLPRGGLPMLLRQARLFSGQRAEIRALNDEFRVRLCGVV
jgi:ATP-dependent DNA helicase RecG